MTVHILIVDDSEEWRSRVRLFFQARPEWQIVCEVSDGPEAVQKAAELRPDLVLLGIALPTLNGIEAARQIRELSPDTKIVFLSMDTSLDARQVALSTGAEGYVFKALAQSDLLPAIDAVLEGRRFVSSMLRGYPLQKAAHRHEVLFYSDDSEFLDRFTVFIAAALEAGDVAIALATDAHRDGLVQKLKARGLDIDAALQEGRYIPLDAGKTLSAFMVNGMPDSNRFFEVAGELVRTAAKAGKRGHPRLAACGECAPLLWEEGKADAAIRVEQLWDQLAAAYEIDTLCGYALSSFRGEEGRRVFQSICAEHSAALS
jgi:DNA-binding NarL/FixJ family response regulator